MENQQKLSKLRVQMEQLESHYKRVFEIEEQIGDLVESDDEDYDSNFLQFETLYIDTKSDILALIDEKNMHTTNESHNSHNQSIVVSTKNVKLPKLEPPKFSGLYSEWTDFKNEFSTMIIQEADLNDIDRFRFLKTCLVGNAKRIISKMETSKENFQSAWKALCSRYENNALILQSHINNIIQMSTINRESADKVREMVDQVSANYRALKSLGTMQEVAENFMICLMLTKLDSGNVEKWEESTTKDIPTWDGFCDFLEKRAMTLEKIEYNKKQTTKPKNSSSQIQKSRSDHSAHTVSTNKCSKCGSSDHNLTSCSQFLALHAIDRYNEVKRMQLCIVCLNPKHAYRFCKASKCGKCHKGHNTLLHFEPSPSDTTKTQAIPSKSDNIHKALVSCDTFSDEPALLATAIVNVFDSNGSMIPCRALLDSGATINIVSEKFYKLLNLKGQRSNINIGGIGSVNISSRSTCRISFTPRFHSSITFNIIAAVLSKISDVHPSHSFTMKETMLIPDEQLADSYFFKPQKINLLIGAGLFWHLLLPGTKYQNSLVIQETKLGWIVSGPLKNDTVSYSTAMVANKKSISGSDQNLYDLVQQFWAVDECISDGAELSEKDKECENHFKDHTQRNTNGSYSVRLPFSKNPSVLGESMHIAMKRFLNIERKLDKQPEIKQMYSEFIKEYEILKHLEVVKMFDSSESHYFLPHHFVLKLSSSSTKLRVVFDASCKNLFRYCFE